MGGGHEQELQLQRKQLCHFHFSSLLNGVHFLNERNCSYRSSFLCFWSRLFIEGLCSGGKQTGS